MDSADWVTIKKIRELTGLSDPTVRRYIKKGLFEAKKLGSGTRPIYVNLLSVPTYLRQGINLDEKKTKTTDK